MERLRVCVPFSRACCPVGVLVLLKSFNKVHSRAHRTQISLAVLVTLLLFAFGRPTLFAQQSSDSVCPRPQPGSVVEEPEDLRSHNGVLEADLTARNAAQSNGS